MKLFKNIFRKLIIGNKADIISCECCKRIKTKGSELIFISWIQRDGSGTTPVPDDMSHLNNTMFSINSLSITKGTFIASEFNSYVVKLKNKS